MKKLILISFLLGIIFASVNAQNSVSIDVTGLDNTSGKLYVALFDSKVPFLSSQAVDGKIADVTDKTVSVTFEDLEAGEYGVAMFYDENANGKLDLGEYGIPTEKYGFSNNVDPATLQRPPVFDECKFEVKGNTVISVKLVSAIK
ncbi:uncharacterized protein (DUF2141 family) [Dysgonomonas sp. PFB1-18]|uniref:DUF2141 domain-containing protein n=1 Tax=unclassified Dysgonomonas TaxID=2630389 RepID=UPI0024752B2B|nr:MULTISPECIES: DUF2141 domain-containing protein [unclassified Dysgonomonas]MDH6310776.1 uncharacterized protein (DUF2141 family) [Dysgonomonas sp. PF1-14]MDH6340626.1 uncharacterized protein (DUF2141 family) [Dysgonomonas sp. PF1-16]MDH6382267.1 uncharacterized protein (DUF2141 family) [Dysgonomonas sp. PFB1-18]MDH6399596.1 uncharacterized protein (DUF2141 family) [Dysgonomonas sp. PF1-23]